MYSLQPAHKIATTPRTPANRPAPILAGVAAAFGVDELTDWVREPEIVVEGRTPPSVCVKVPAEVIFANGLDETVGVELTLTEESDPVDVAKAEVVGGVGVSVDVLDT